MTPRSPALVVVAVVVLLIGLGIITLGIMNFAALGWLFATIVIISGLASVSLVTMAIITGRPEWLLFDLILPG